MEFWYILEIKQASPFLDDLFLFFFSGKSENCVFSWKIEVTWGFVAAFFQKYLLWGAHLKNNKQNTPHPSHHHTDTHTHTQEQPTQRSQKNLHWEKTSFKAASFCSKQGVFLLLAFVSTASVKNLQASAASSHTYIHIYSVTHFGTSPLAQL